MDWITVRTMPVVLIVPLPCSQGSDGGGVQGHADPRRPRGGHVPAEAGAGGAAGTPATVLRPSTDLRGHKRRLQRDEEATRRGNSLIPRNRN